MSPVRQIGEPMDALPMLLALTFLLVGLSFAVFGMAGPGKLLRAVFAPIGCLLKTVAVLVLLLLGGLFFLGSRLGVPMGSPASAPPVAETPPSTAVGEVLLDEYPVLAQRDLALYEPEEFADTTDESLDEPVRHLTCLATVYLMLKRGRGEPAAMISAETYDMDNGAINPGYVGADTTLDGLQVVQDIQAGRPVVLHAVGGPLGHHFVLAVGLRPVRHAALSLLGRV